MDLKKAYLRLFRGANFCLPGRIVDHNVHRWAMPLPPKGRIVTLLVEVKDDVSDPLSELRNGHYELDMWVNIDRYNKVLCGLSRPEKITECQPVMMYFSSCEGVENAPEDVEYMAIVAQHLASPVSLPHRELHQRVGGAARLLKPGPDGWDFDQYVKGRAIRHRKSLLAKQATLTPELVSSSQDMTFDEYGLRRAAREANC